MRPDNAETRMSTDSDHGLHHTAEDSIVGSSPSGVPENQAPGRVTESDVSLTNPLAFHITEWAPGPNERPREYPSQLLLTFDPYPACRIYGHLLELGFWSASVEHDIRTSHGNNFTAG